MRHWRKVCIVLLSCYIIGMYSYRKNFFIEQDRNVLKGLEPLLEVAIPIGKPKPGEWLYEHFEWGQTLSWYISTDPPRPNDKWKTLYVLPLGDFTKTQRKIVTDATIYMEAYFGTPVKILEDAPSSDVPASARRINPLTNNEQILATWVLDYLTKKRPKDCVTIIAFTAKDLYPEPSWNFVFGMASLRERVGVWSIYRKGDPESDYSKVLRRTIKTATHEVGHNLGMEHCISYRCNMNGINSLTEADTKGLDLCPVCLSKLKWATKIDVEKRYKKLIELCKKHNFPKELERFNLLFNKYKGIDAP